MSPQSVFASRMIQIGGLPSTAELRALARSGCLSLVNVSGSPLREMLGPQAVAVFELSEHRFSDLFSKRALLETTSSAADEPSLFLDTFVPEQQNGFLQSVQAASNNLRAHKNIYLFCHHGVGRSPAVAMTLMRLVWHWPLSEAIQTVQQIRPQAHISDLSVSASAWALARLQPH